MATVKRALEAVDKLEWEGRQSRQMAEKQIGCLVKGARLETYGFKWPDDRDRVHRAAALLCRADRLQRASFRLQERIDRTQLGN